MGEIDLFKIIWDALSPYAFAILKLALAITLFSFSLKILRQRTGSMGMGGGNPWSGLWAAFIGYLLGRGIPIIIGITDKICNDILARLPH